MARPLKPGPPTPSARDLYRKAREYHAARPWEALADDAVFGVEDPESGTVAWCSVLGAAGVMYGLAVYDGAEGLALYQGIMNETVSVDDVQMSHRGFLVAFGRRDLLERSEIEALRTTPPSPPARDAWPMMRMLEPGYPPAVPDDPACRRLSIVLEQVLAVAASARGRTDAVAP